MQGFILLEVRGSEDALPLVDGANVFGFAFCLPVSQLQGGLRRHREEDGGEVSWQ